LLPLTETTEISVIKAVVLLSVSEGKTPEFEGQVLNLLSKFNCDNFGYE